MTVDRVGVGREGMKSALGGNEARSEAWVFEDTNKEIDGDRTGTGYERVPVE